MLLPKIDIIIPPQDIACHLLCLAKLANGDREAFAWAYKNYCKKIYDYTLLLTADIELSEDIVQEVFLRVWEKRKN